MADIDKVLEFEPRHFGALVGRAVMYKNQGKDDLALKDMLAALAIHPFLAERAMFPECSKTSSGSEPLTASGSDAHMWRSISGTPDHERQRTDGHTRRRPDPWPLCHPAVARTSKPR